MVVTFDQSKARLVRPRPDLLAFLGYFALTAVFFAPFLAGWRVFPPGDFGDHFLPFSLFQQAELLAGRLPLWNPYTFAGHPFLADTQAAVFYPLSNLLLLLTLPWRDPAARLYWLQVEAGLQVALAGCFTYLLARDLLQNRGAAFLAGGIFAFSGYLTGYPPLQLAVLRTAIWLPLILWLLHRAFDRPAQWRWWLAAVLAYVVAFLAGHPQTFLFQSYAVAGWMLFLLARAYRDPVSRRNGVSMAGHLWRAALFYGSFLALSAAQMWPSLEFTGLSVRANVDYAFVSGGFPLSDTGQMLLPGVLSEFSPLYVGLIPLGLAVLAVIALIWRRPTRDGVAPAGDARSALFFAALVALALLVSYGNHGFLYPVFYRWAPGWAMFRGQERAAYLVAFGVSLLAGYGAAALAQLAPRWRQWMGLTYAWVAGAGLIAVAVLAATADVTGIKQSVILRGAVTGVFLLAAWAVLLWDQRFNRHRLWLLTALAVADLFFANIGTNLSPPVPLPPPEVSALRAAAQSQGAVSEQGAARVHNDARVFDDYGMVVGVEDISGSSPLRLARYAALLDGFPRDRLWRLTGVALVLAGGEDLYVPADRLAEVSGLHGPSYLYRLQAANPRAWVATTVRTADDAAALPLLGDASFDLETTVLLPPTVNGQGRPAGLEDGPLARPGVSQVRLERLAPNRLRVHVQSEGGGLLVVSENWLPGWRATVQRVSEQAVRELPVLRADLTFLGVPVSPGAQTVELTYWPDSVRYGLCISAFSVLLLLGAVAWRRWMRGARSAQVARWAEMGWRWVKRVSPLVIVLAALALRVLRLDFQELRGDEAFTYIFSQGSLLQIARETLTVREAHPLGAYSPFYLWQLVAGHSEFALRFLDVWFGVLAVALLYRLGRQLSLGKMNALLAAGLLAASPFAVWHSQDARMYSPSLALTMASTVLALAVWVRPGWRRWLAYGLVSWWALNTHYYALFIVAVQNLALLGFAARRREWRLRMPRWLLAQVVVVALCVPWWILARDTFSMYHGNGDSPGLAAAVLRSFGIFAIGESLPDGQRLFFALIASALLLVGGIRLARGGTVGRRAVWLLTLYLGVPLLATWVMSIARPVFIVRYLIAAAPPFYLLLAAGAASFRSAGTRVESAAGDRHLRWIGGLLLGALALGMGLALVRQYDDAIFSKTRGWRTLAAVLTRHSAGYADGAVRVAQTYPDPTLWYYYDGPADHFVLPPAAFDVAGAEQEVATLAAADAQRVVIAVQQSAAWDDQGIASAALAKHYTLLLETPVSDWKVQVYERPPARMVAQEVLFVGGLRLTGAAVPAERLLAGDLVPIYLRWDAAAGALRGQEKITLQLLDAGGKLVAQTDQPFDPTLFRYTLALPRFLQPGAYQLILALYDPTQPSAPRLLTADGADHVTLVTRSAP